MAEKPKWRNFEQLVTAIEQHLCPHGATVLSPDHIIDKTTGQSREVDASVRYRIGSVPILITIECRDRTATQDVTWIEQLIAKRESVGASATIAVSSTGFSGPALDKAKANEIEARVLREVSEESIRDWAAHLEIVVVRGKFGMGTLRARIKPAPGNPTPELHADVKAEYAKGDVEYKFIRRSKDGRMVSIGDLLRDAERELGNQVVQVLDGGLTIRVPPESSAAVAVNAWFPSLFEDVPIGEPPAIKMRAWTFDPGEASVETERGSAEIEYLDVELKVIQRAYPSQVGRLLAYEAPTGRIANVEQREISLGDGESIRVTISGGNDESGGGALAQLDSEPIHHPARATAG